MREQKQMYLCAGPKIGGSHFWNERVAYEPQELGLPLLVDCPAHDGAERSVTTEALHIHECFECAEVFTHRESGCGGDARISQRAQRFTCWNCKAGR
jgi:hypothetical protein